MSKNKGDLVCKWTHCSSHSVKFGSPEELSLHVDQSHLQLCVNNDLFFCLWEGCKVYNKPSYSYSWLRRHTKEKHTKERPNRCLMNGCNKAFNSIDALQRHMMRHFDRTPPPTSAGKAVQSNPSMLMMSSRSEECASSDVASISSSVSNLKDAPCSRSRKKHSLRARVDATYGLVHTQQVPIAFNGVHFHDEVVDGHTMDVVRQTSNVLACLDTHTPQPSTLFSLTGQVVGRRRRAAGTEPEVLVRWRPRLLPDCWVPVSSFKRHRVVTTSDLSPGQLSTLADKCFGCPGNKNRKSKRKP